MKFKFISLLFFAMLPFISVAQQQINTEFKTKTLQVFQSLDKNRVPHGILLDFGMEFTNLQAFNGTLTDSTYTNSQTMSDVYKTLLMCRVRSNVTTGFITPQEYATRWYSQRTQGVITLSGQYFKYNRFADNAYPSKLNYANNQFSDKFVGSVWQNPYEEKQLFAMTTSIAKYKGFNFQVKLPANLFLTNYPATVQNIQVDFSDGLGYRIVDHDQLVNVTYTQANTYTWKYKITLTNGQTLLSHSKIEIEEGIKTRPFTPTNTSLLATQAATTVDLSAYAKTTITATTAYNGWLGSATVYVRYANGGNTITKPLIIAEGFDTGVILTPEQEAGDNNIDQFIKSTEFIRSNSSALEGEINTYDIIYVDWNNGVDFIQRNAFVLEEVIKWVNQNKSGSLQNVVLGQSMGGLVARYALKDMENKGLNHDTRLYVSHDAPHLGANVPLSVQHSARHLRNMYVNTPIPLLLGEVVLPIIFNFADGVIEIINGNTNWTVNGQPLQEVDYITPLTAFSIADTPASRQMQYNWVNRNYELKNTIHDIWQQELSNLGYPVGFPSKPIRNIAIANGSECGVTQIDNGNIMSYVKDAGRNTLLSNYIGIMDAIYGTLITNPLVVVTALFPGKSYWQIDFQSKYMTTLNENKNIYHGSIKYKKKVFWFIPVSITITEKDVNQPSGILPYDIYSGGNQKSPTNNIPLDNIVSNSFGFIPTASSLDIGKGMTVINDIDYRKSYVGALPPASPKNSPFQNFVTHFDKFNPNSSNSRHISFNRRNGNWLANEFSNTPITTNCSFICGDAKINGVDSFCLSSNYSVSNSATTYNWSITSINNIATITSGQGTNSVILSAVNPNLEGFITLSCYIGNFECGYTTILKRIHIGRPTIENFTPIQGAYSWVARGYANNHSVYTTPIEATTSYRWEITMDNGDFNYDCTGVLNPSFAKFNNNGSTVTPITTATYTSNVPNASINWGRCSGSYVLTLIAINECGETEVAAKYVTVGKPEDNPCDNSGTFETSAITATPNPIEEGEIIVINVAPNYEPCDLTFTSGEIGAINKEVTIYDLQGNQKYYNNLPVIDDKININNHGLEKGHYIVHVKSPNGHIKKGHIIIKKN